jgi:hypothetical protein
LARKYLGGVPVITVVCWWWGHKYPSGHVAKLQSMLSRHLTLPHRLVCLTDKPTQLPAGVIPAKLPKPLPFDGKCLRRMWLYSAKAGRLGDRLLQLDLDVVITANIDALVDRPEPFVIWKSDSNWKDGWAYNATVMLITPGAKDDVWQRFSANPKRIFDEAEADDQAIACYLMKDQQVPVWHEADGIRAYRVFAGKHGDRGQFLPVGTKIVSFHGPRDPGVADLQAKSPWIAEHWR